MVKAVSYGDRSGLRAIRQRHGKWIKSINDNYSSIKKMNEEKDWDPDNDDDDEDFDSPESIKDMNDADAKSLLSTYVEGLLEGYRSLEKNLTALVGNLQSGGMADSSQLIESACIVLRFVSIIRTTSPQQRNANIIDLNWFGKEAKRELHTILSKGVSRKALRGFTKDISHRRWSSDVVFDSLWDGELNYMITDLFFHDYDLTFFKSGSPKLPSQPSPLVFKFLRSLVQSMNELGVDVWSRDAADTLKRSVRKSLWEELENSLESVGKQVNGIPAASSEGLGIETEEKDGEDAGAVEAETLTSSELNREQVLQAYFDTTYLDNALRAVSSRAANSDDKGGETGSDIALAWELIEWTRNKVVIESDERERISRSAEDYWRRTSLLFGVLDI
ncbi:hypothetical protein ABW19_dt0200444 [Dactylella cylindrospora]|nr:hypothetical protein ABW19_dt0200444 [Dactylella cylindrospora]